MQAGGRTQIWGVGMETSPRRPNTHVLENLLFEENTEEYFQSKWTGQGGLKN